MAAVTADPILAASFATGYSALKDELPGSDLPWLTALRDSGITLFNATGLPTPKSEAWKYTNLRLLEKAGFAPGLRALPSAGIDRVPELMIGRPAPHRLVFVNGHLDPELSSRESLPPGVTLRSLAEVMEHEPGLLESDLGQVAGDAAQPLLALNTALMEDGLVLSIGHGVRVEDPIEAVFVGGLATEPVAYHPRHLVVLEDNAAASLIEHHVGPDGVYFANNACEVRIGQGARLRHSKLQAESADAFHIGTLHARIARDGLYEAFCLSLGARLSRNETSVRLEGPGAECRLSGAYLMRDRQHCDNTTVIEHAAPHTTSREVFKGVLDDKARAVFQGRIVVQPDAQQTDGHQLSKALLLSDGAEIDAKPELEIYADDVKCSHGATAGEIDYDALFYLRTRGITEAQARNLLIRAFLAEALEEISDQEIRGALSARVDAWFGGAQGGQT